jgi:hypothetical protein
VLGKQPGGVGAVHADIRLPGPSDFRYHLLEPGKVLGVNAGHDLESRRASRPSGRLIPFGSA